MKVSEEGLTFTWFAVLNRNYRFWPMIYPTSISLSWLLHTGCDWHEWNNKRGHHFQITSPNIWHIQRKQIKLKLLSYWLFKDIGTQKLIQSLGVTSTAESGFPNICSFWLSQQMLLLFIFRLVLIWTWILFTQNVITGTSQLTPSYYITLI